MVPAVQDDPILRVREVSKSFSGLVAVDKLSFDLISGDVMGLIGPNGSGKTTVINLLSGAIKPTTGQILMHDQEIGNMPAHRIYTDGIARTFQIVRILPTMSLLENVAVGGVFGHRRYWGQKLNARAGQVLERVGLDHGLDAPVTTLTYINQKRVELARALMSDPDILLLDEWLAGLNQTELATGISLIRDLSAEGRTIIVVEHVMDAIRSLCDRCVVMNGGKKIAEGTPENVLADREVISAYLGDHNA